MDVDLTTAQREILVVNKVALSTNKNSSVSAGTARCRECNMVGPCYPSPLIKTREHVSQHAPNYYESYWCESQE